MSRTWFVLALSACTSMPSSGRPFSPANPGVGAAPAAVAPVGPQGDASAFQDDRPADEASAPPSDREPAAEDRLARQLKFLAEQPASAPAPAASAPSAGAVGALAAAPSVPAPAAPVWDPTRPLPDTSFGVRVLGVLLDLQPPRAILGLPDGREQVVTPGAMLPTEGLVVLAIGRDAVQIARVTPQGFYARVETEVVPSLFPSRAP